MNNEGVGSIMQPPQGENNFFDSNSRNNFESNWGATKSAYGNFEVNQAAVESDRNDYESSRGVTTSQTGRRDYGLEAAMGIVSIGAMDEKKEQIEIISTVKPEKLEEILPATLENVPEEAKDGEKMEKAWMERARGVVKETRNDPSKRLAMVGLLREEYMRKRFNKILGEHN